MIPSLPFCVFVCKSDKTLISDRRVVFDTNNTGIMSHEAKMEEYQVTVRQAIADDAHFLVDFTKADGWDFSEFDYKSDFAIDPDFLRVAVDCSDRPVGFGGIIKVGPNTMHLDAYIVREDLRHKGIGSKIWNTLLQRAWQSNVCLDSVSGSTEWYRKQGFIYESFKLHSYSTVVTSDMKTHFKSPYDVIPLSENMWPRLMDYDRQVFPDFDREKILRAWCRDSIAVVARSEGNIVGYGCMHKKYENAYGLRNVFGDNENVIETILRYLTANVPDGSLVHFALLDGKPVPGYINKNCTYYGTSQRMFNKAIIKVNGDKIWLHSRSKI